MTQLASGALVAGRFRLDRLLGEGGMGEVWSATHEITGGRVALKFLKAANVPRAEARKRFLREARAAALLDHPSVVQIRDVVEHEDMPVLVMDLLLGETLASRLAKRGRIDLPDVARIGLQIVAAVGAAHEAGLIHRDLKPENVFLARVTGVGEVARVLDFGIAKLIDDGLDGATVTQSGTMLGTPAYMAPEQVFGERELDYRVDVWALGVLLHEMLVGVRPVDGENYGQIARKLLSEPLRSIRALRSDLPEDVASLVDRLLVRDRKERLSDLHEVVDVLARYSDARPPAFGPPREKSSSGPISSRDAPPDAAPRSPRLEAPVLRASDPVAATLMQAGMAPPRLDTEVAHVTSPPPATSPKSRRGSAAAGVVTVAALLLIGLGVRSILARRSTSNPAPRPASELSAESAPAWTRPPSPAQPPVAQTVVASASSSAAAPAPPETSPPPAVAPVEHRPRSPATGPTVPPSAKSSAPAAASSAAAAPSVLAPPPPSATTGGLVTKPPF